MWRAACKPATTTRAGAVAVLWIAVQHGSMHVCVEHVIPINGLCRGQNGCQHNRLASRASGKLHLMLHSWSSSNDNQRARCMQPGHVSHDPEL